VLSRELPDHTRQGNTEITNEETGSGLAIVHSDGWPVRSSNARVMIFSHEGGLEGLPLRVSNEGSPRPRVARAQETL